MIKVNYDPKTGKVIAFGKDIEPYIEITEEARKQPLPNKYSWYAVENNKFVIKSRTPTAEEEKFVPSAKTRSITSITRNPAACASI